MKLYQRCLARLIERLVLAEYRCSPFVTSVKLMKTKTPRLGYIRNNIEECFASFYPNITAMKYFKVTFFIEIKYRHRFFDCDSKNTFRMSSNTGCNHLSRLWEQVFPLFKKCQIFEIRRSFTDNGGAKISNKTEHCYSKFSTKFLRYSTKSKHCVGIALCDICKSYYYKSKTDEKRVLFSGYKRDRCIVYVSKLIRVEIVTLIFVSVS